MHIVLYKSYFIFPNIDGNYRNCVLKCVMHSFNCFSDSITLTNCKVLLHYSEHVEKCFIIYAVCIIFRSCHVSLSTSSASYSKILSTAFFLLRLNNIKPI